MLSEICVRRPVFATMLVMSLVVLGIFSFRDLGVDLFRADPATVNVELVAPGARRRDFLGRRRWKGDQRSLRHRRAVGPHQRGRRHDHGPFLCSSAPELMRPTTCAKVAAAIRRAASCCRR
jgi:hypothetical protein